MITSTRRVSADKPEVQIAFSLDETSGKASTTKNVKIIVLDVFVTVNERLK